MIIKVDVTKVTCYSDSTIYTLLVYGKHTAKECKEGIKTSGFFKNSSFKIVEVEKMKGVEIPVVNDSVSQSISEFFDVSATIDIDSDDEVVEDEGGTN